MEAGGAQLPASTQTMSDLTILCITNYGHHADHFLYALDDLAMKLDCEFVEYNGSNVAVQCVEDVLDDAIHECLDDGWILRLDDDETVTYEMEQWLRNCTYREADHWAFPRYNLYPDTNSYITTPPLYPDLQTRLSVKQKSGGRRRLHQGSPHGTGRIAPVHIEHHKFLVRDLAERRQLLADYNRLGASSHHAPFSVPEDFPHLIIATRTAVNA